jgi:hypothetical protein
MSTDLHVMGNARWAEVNRAEVMDAAISVPGSVSRS